ncbi:hypothetical protein AVEN_159400-1 [Araneus ventricosus]|uniref:Uncharacterized protein n=1 Tax=Araneus ventricosus TaxID=182803 RepID=A0A4Y2A0V2_ARAVE|nr:hypothetical protein AVEN_159400-1 [Araneus ventricosus]
MGKNKSGPFSGQHTTSIPQRNNFPIFFIIQRKSESKETFHGVSPFLVEKAISGSIGEVKSTKKLRSGDLLVEVGSFKQAKEIVKLKSLSTIPIQVCPPPTLNSSKGVIFCGELLNVPVEEITEKLQKARKIVKSKFPADGNSYASAFKKISATVSTQWDLADIPSGTNLKPSACTIITSSPVNALNPSPVPVSICESTPVTADLNGFQLVTNRKKLKKDSPTKTKSTSKAEKNSKFYTSSREVHASIVKQNNSNMQPIINATVISDETILTPLVASAALSMSFPPLGEKRVLQSRESDADAEMSSSSALEGDTLEYNMSEDLEDSPAVTSPPPSSKPERKNKYRNR